ncbi:site-specific integrase [Celeribacter sp. PS-C1]|uniref:site-specific integrase n=1 Tax=Celeribacter sp. PS-C1 TaxID=2820813 RepID=UPI001CA5410C|nr:site-specific integrase [Celeribacter sp. PS-C1]MBW6419643.1 site-specific integrase [Celeribacter sp. PS-C1]
MTYQNQATFVEPTSNLLDALNWAEASGEPYDAICEVRKIPARLNLTDHDLISLSADLVNFEKNIAPSAYGAVSNAKDLETARRRGNSRVRNLLKRFHEARDGAPASTGREQWDALIAFVSDREGFADRGAEFTTGQSRGLTALRSRSPVAPKDLSQSDIDRMMANASSEKRKSIRKAITFLNRLTEDYSGNPDLAGVLPAERFDLPASPDRARAIAWDSLPAALRASAEAAMSAAVAGPMALVEQARTRIRNGEDAKTVMAELNETASMARKAPQNPDAAKSSYHSAITWLFRAAEDIGRDVSTFETLDGLYDPEILDAACQQQIERSTCSEALKDPKKTQTLGARLTALGTLARHGMHRSDLAALVDFQKQLHAEHVVKPGKVTSESADALCRLIQTSPHLAANFVNAPKTIADAAEEKIRVARESGDKEREARGLRLFATAVAFALQVSRPVRTSNVIRLRHRSSGSLPGHLEWVEKGKHARLTFKEREVKNGKVIVVHLENDEASILWTWLTEHRARFIQLRGLEDSAYVIPGDAMPRLQKRDVSLPRGCVAPSTMSEIWHEGARLIGIDLTPHQARHAIATLILAVEPGNFAKVASVLGDTEETVRKHYGRDSGEAAAREVRAVLKSRHPKMFRKMKGGA